MVGACAHHLADGNLEVVLQDSKDGEPQKSASGIGLWLNDVVFIELCVVFWNKDQIHTKYRSRPSSPLMKWETLKDTDLEWWTIILGVTPSVANVGLGEAMMCCFLYERGSPWGETGAKKKWDPPLGDVPWDHRRRV